MRSLGWHRIGVAACLFWLATLSPLTTTLAETKESENVPHLLERLFPRKQRYHRMKIKEATRQLKSKISAMTKYSRKTKAKSESNSSFKSSKAGMDIFGKMSSRKTTREPTASPTSLPILVSTTSAQPSDQPSLVPSDAPSLPPSPVPSKSPSSSAFPSFTPSSLPSSTSEPTQDLSNDSPTQEEDSDPLFLIDCGCESCTQTVLQSFAGTFRCGDRIQYIFDQADAYLENDDEGGDPTLEDACQFVGETQPPCSPCACLV